VQEASEVYGVPKEHLPAPCRGLYSSHGLEDHKWMEEARRLVLQAPSWKKRSAGSKRAPGALCRLDPKRPR